MTDLPAVFQADFVDLAFKPGLKVARVSFDLPIEYAAAFIQAFGAPDRVSPVKCAIARLVEPAAVSKADLPIKEAKRLREMPLSQQCALMCSNPKFQEWLGCETEGDAVEEIKTKINIHSRRELDVDEDKAGLWKGIHTSYDYGEPYAP